MARRLDKVVPGRRGRPSARALAARRRRHRGGALTLLAALVALVPAPAASAQTAPCEKRVAFALVEVTTAGCLDRVAPDRWETADAVSLNGLPVPVAPGTRLVLSAPTAGAPGGALSVATTITLSGVTVYRGEWRLALPAGGRGEEHEAAAFSPSRGQTLFGLSIGGSAVLRLGYGADGRHYALFRVVLDLPAVFRSGPSANAGGLTATVGVRVDAAGVHTDAVKAEVRDAYVGQVGIRHLCLSYTAAGTTSTTPCQPPAFGAQPLLTCSAGTGASRWDGSAVIVLPTQSHTEVGVFAGLRDGRFSYAGGQVSKLGNAVPLATGVYLERVGLAICVNPPPLRLKGAAAIRFGPEVAGQQVALLDGSIEYIDSRPWVIDARGSLTLFGRGFSSAYFRYASSGSIDFGFAAALDFKVVSLRAQVDGWVEIRRAMFNVDGRGEVCVAGVACARGEVTLNTGGVAGCFTLSEFTYYVLVKDHDWAWYAPWRVHWEPRTARLAAGADYRWQTGRLSVLGNACDIAPYRLARTAVVSAVGERTIRLPNEPGVALRLKGAGAPPDVVLAGPHGRHIGTPNAGGVIEENRDVVVKDDAADTTQILIAAPRPGRWRIKPNPGSAQLVSVERAGTEEAPTIVADVSEHGGRRVLGYAFSSEGQEITFVERTEDHAETVVLGRAHGGPCPGDPDGPADRGRPHCGKITFTPPDGSPGRRNVYAVISEGGIAYDERLVATYHAAPQGRPARPQGVRLRRRKSSVLVTWRAGAPDLAHTVSASLSDGRRIVLDRPSGSRRALIRPIRRHVRVRVRVVAVDSDGRRSAAVRTRLRARR